MNWTWSIRSRDGGMNGLEFARCTSAGGVERALVHAAPAHLSVDIVDDSGRRVAAGDLERAGEYTPMTLLEIGEGRLRRREVWPDAGLVGLPVLLAGGEAGILTAWEHAGDRSWWRWSVEFSNHVGRPPDWAPAETQRGQGPSRPER